MKHTSSLTFRLAEQRGLVLKGKVCIRFVTCHKPNCHCTSGERHGPYYYRVWRDGVHVRKAYIPREDVEIVEAACEAYRHCRQSLKTHADARRNMSREIVRAFRDTMKASRDLSS